MRHIIRLLSVAVLLALPVSAANGRWIENWPYDKLFKEADLVVIAEAKAVTDVDDTPQFDWHQDRFAGQNTTFSVLHTLKGKLAGAELKVLHFRIKGEDNFKNGPMLVAFRTKGGEVTLKDRKLGWGPPTYMLFLKARKDGRYEPVSGQYDPVQSVRELNFPLDELFDK